MVTVVAAIVAVIGSLIGVMIGAWLTPWLQSRAEIRKIFLDALGAVAQLDAAQNWLVSSVNEGFDGLELNTELSHRRLDEFGTSIITAQRTLAIASTRCPELREYLHRWSEAFQSAEDRAAIEALLKSSLRRLTAGQRLR